MGSASRFLIFLGGEPVPYSRFKELVPHSILLACDSGIELLWENHLFPHVFVGDLDSADQEVLASVKPYIKNFYQFPVEKDKTDSELGVEYALSAGAREIVLVGGLGQRLDHTLANILLLLKIREAGVQGSIIGAKERIFCLSDEFELRGKPGLAFSLIPLGLVTNLNIIGAHYSLLGGKLYPGNSMGISNYMEGELLEIKKEGGPLIMILLEGESNNPLHLASF